MLFLTLFTYGCLTFLVNNDLFVADAFCLTSKKVRLGLWQGSLHYSLNDNDLFVANTFLWLTRRGLWQGSCHSLIHFPLTNWFFPSAPSLAKTFFPFLDIILKLPSRPCKAPHPKNEILKKSLGMSEKVSHEWVNIFYNLNTKSWQDINSANNHHFQTWAEMCPYWGWNLNITIWW